MSKRRLPSPVSCLYHKLYSMGKEKASDVRLFRIVMRFSDKARLFP